jgi:hypothetical protein
MATNASPSLPPANPLLAPEAFADLNHQAELALARLSGVSGLVPSVGCRCAAQSSANT